MRTGGERMMKLSFFGFGILSLTMAIPAQAITFERACDRGDSITLAAVGDVLMHQPLQSQAYASRNSFGSIWSGIEDLIQAADFAYANLEGPLANGVNKAGRSVKDPGMKFDGEVYSGFPLFNFHPILAWDLKEAGFDIVSTSNNHSMDRGPLGVDRTIENLQSANLPFTGTRTVEQAKSGVRPWVTMTKKSGWSIAWIGCSFSTNGVADPHKQVLGCFRDADEIEKTIQSLAKNPNVDAVIVTPHWGEVEYSHTVEKSQRALAIRFLNAGAAGIFGNHPHVIKPWEKITTKDGRETFVIYSIGNFASNQSSLAKQSTAIVYLGLTKAPGQKAWVNGATYVPLYMLRKRYEVVAVDRSDRAPREAAKLVAKYLGSERRISSRDRIETNPECR